MYEQITTREMTNIDYLQHYYSYSPSTSMTQADVSDLVDAMLSILIRSHFKHKFSFNLGALFNIDISSVLEFVFPNVGSETFLTTEKRYPLELIEHDIVVHMVPKRRYAIEVNIRSITKGHPIIVEPEISNMGGENE